MFELAFWFNGSEVYRDSFQHLSAVSAKVLEIATAYETNHTQIDITFV